MLKNPQSKQMANGSILKDNKQDDNDGDGNNCYQHNHLELVQDKMSKVAKKEGV